MFVIDQVSQMAHNVMDIVNNSGVTSTSALPFVEFTFYNFMSKTVLHQKYQKEINVNIRNDFHH